MEHEPRLASTAVRTSKRTQDFDPLRPFGPSSGSNGGNSFPELIVISFRGCFMRTQLRRSYQSRRWRASGGLHLLSVRLGSTQLLVYPRCALTLQYHAAISREVCIEWTRLIVDVPGAAEFAKSRHHWLDCCSLYGLQEAEVGKLKYQKHCAAGDASSRTTTIRVGN